MSIPIIFEDADVLVIHKPSGIAAQTTASNSTSVQDFFKGKYYVVHRLDQRVSGLMLLAKNAIMANALSELFKTGKIKKQYKAIVAEKLPTDTDTLTHWLQHKGNESKAKIFTAPTKDAKRVVLQYKCIAASQKYYLLQIDLKTGRFHQIRAQLAAVGSPIVGDVKYGYKRTTADGSIFLQSSFVQFVHPITTKQLTFQLEIPLLWNKFGFQ